MRLSNKEIMRNLLLAVAALGTLIVFFGFDLFDGTTRFSFASSSVPRISFGGKLGKGEIPADQMERLEGYLSRKGDLFESVSVLASKQDSYASGPKAQVLYEIQAVLVSGAKLHSPVHRTTMSRLVPSIIAKLKKDEKAYRSVYGDPKRKSGNTLVNSM